MRLVIITLLAMSSSAFSAAGNSLEDIKKVIAIQQKMISELRDLIGKESQEFDESQQALNERINALLGIGDGELSEGELNSPSGLKVGGHRVVDKNAKWINSYGDGGWINATHGGGWFMRDSQWVRSWQGKNVYTPGVMQADGGYKIDGKSFLTGDGKWMRTYGDGGWKNETWGGGWMMKDHEWLRSVNDKNVYTARVVQADGGFKIDGKTALSGDGKWLLTHGSGGWKNETWGGGWFMQDQYWIRSKNNKNVYTGGGIKADGGFYVGVPGGEVTVVDGNGRIANQRTLSCKTVAIRSSCGAGYVFTGASFSYSTHQGDTTTRISGKRCCTIK